MHLVLEVQKQNQSLIIMYKIGEPIQILFWPQAPVSLNDSGTPLSSVVSNSTIRNLVIPDDSASNISEVISESSLQEVASIYQINDFNTYSALISVPNANFSHIVVYGIHQYFVIIGNAILSVNPDIMNYFLKYKVNYHNKMVLYYQIFH